MASNESPVAQHVLAQSAVSRISEALLHVTRMAEDATSPSFLGWTVDKERVLCENAVSLYITYCHKAPLTPLYVSDLHRSGNW